MTTTKHLQLIKAECERCIANGRDNGINKWTERAEAGWRATIAAIESCLADDETYQDMYSLVNADLITIILAAWPLELLTTKPE